jgi:hypothetical protein
VGAATLISGHSKKILRQVGFQTALETRSQLHFLRSPRKSPRLRVGAHLCSSFRATLRVWQGRDVWFECNTAGSSLLCC